MCRDGPLLSRSGPNPSSVVHGRIMTELTGSSLIITTGRHAEGARRNDT
ncbi:MAG: hypothetical protein ACJAYU_000452 [Bradymonadia bacterium]|jgi:hypothetical protein